MLKRMLYKILHHVTTEARKYRKVQKWTTLTSNGHIYVNVLLICCKKIATDNNDVKDGMCVLQGSG